jgi:hypothetical protein
MPIVSVRRFGPRQRRSGTSKRWRDSISGPNETLRPGREPANRSKCPFVTSRCRSFDVRPRTWHLTRRSFNGCAWRRGRQPGSSVSLGHGGKDERFSSAGQSSHAQPLRRRHHRGLLGRRRARRDGPGGQERSGKSKNSGECNLLEHVFPLCFLGLVRGTRRIGRVPRALAIATGEPMGEMSKINGLGVENRVFRGPVLKPFTQAKLRFIVCVNL